MTIRATHAHQASGAPGYADRRVDYLRRLNKIEGQVRGIARMVDEDRYCIDVLTQAGQCRHQSTPRGGPGPAG